MVHWNRFGNPYGISRRPKFGFPLSKGRESWVSAVVGCDDHGALAKKVRAAEHHRPTMSQDLWVGRVFGSGLVSWRGNGTSVGVGLYDPPGNPQYSLRNQPGSEQAPVEVRLPYQEEVQDVTHLQGSDGFIAL